MKNVQILSTVSQVQISFPHRLADVKKAPVKPAAPAVENGVEAEVVEAEVVEVVEDTPNPQV